MAEVLQRTVKSSQEQAIASWVTYLNQIRLDTLIDRLNTQDLNLQEALSELAELKAFIGNPEHILGSAKSKHGEIAEHMQVNISNARRAVQGLSKEYTFKGVGRTAPEDYLKNGQQIQSKFYNGLKQTFFNNHGLEDHLKTYPDFVKNGGSYDIPKEQYEQMMDLLKKYKQIPPSSELTTKELALAKRINEFLEKNNLNPEKDITPATNTYSEVQTAVANKTVEKEEKNIKKEDEKRRKEAYEDSKPTIKEAGKAVGISAVVEGGISFCLSVAKKRKEKEFSQFTSEDWAEIGVDTGKSAIKGGIRGGAIYTFTNFTATPANIASAYVTAAFGVAEQVRALEEGKVSKEDFVINCETVCLDVSVSAIASLAGQVLIPIPILGAVIGNVAGEFVYEICKKEGTKKSQQIVDSYKKEMDILNKQLFVKFMDVFWNIQESLRMFGDLEKLAFDIDTNVAFNGSIHLAEEVGVDSSKILHSISQIDDFFLA